MLSFCNILTTVLASFSFHGIWLLHFKVYDSPVKCQVWKAPAPRPWSALHFVDKHPDQGTPGGSIHIPTVASLLIALLPQEIHSTFRQGNNSVVFIEIYIW